MKISAIGVQVRNPDRVNVSIDGKYRFSLDITQVVDLGLKVSQEIDEADLLRLEEESQFGKLYGRALEYALIRPRSIREMRDYLYRKTQASRYRSRRTGEIVERPGVAQSVADRVLDRLVNKQYLDDEKFAQFWLDNRFLSKGVSLRRLSLELTQKGVSRDIVERAISQSQRNDSQELKKMITKKQSRYPDPQKLIQYLVRQGFSYEDVKRVLDQRDDT